jgi:hypothetical protein
MLACVSMPDPKKEASLGAACEQYFQTFHSVVVIVLALVAFKEQ